jgi:hypothetical protein
MIAWNRNLLMVVLGQFLSIMGFAFAMPPALQPSAKSLDNVPFQRHHLHSKGGMDGGSY